MIKRFWKDKQYIGIRDHQMDSFGNWIDVYSAKIYTGKPDSSYTDEVYEFTPETWAELKSRIQSQANKLKREFAETPVMMTSYPIWIHTPILV